MIRLILNGRKPYNYAFFDPKSRLHLTVTNPVGFAQELTPAILRGLASNVIIDAENVVDIKKGCLKQKQNADDKTPAKAKVEEDGNDVLKAEEPVKEEIPVAPVEEEPQPEEATEEEAPAEETTSEESTEEPTEEPKKKASGKRGSKKK